VSSVRIIRAMVMKTVRTSETSVNFNVTTRRYIPEDAKLREQSQLNNLNKLNYAQSQLNNLYKSMYAQSQSNNLNKLN
jgi:hypothetical protein